MYALSPLAKVSCHYSCNSSRMSNKQKSQKQYLNWFSQAKPFLGGEGGGGRRQASHDRWQGSSNRGL